MGGSVALAGWLVTGTGFIFTQSAEIEDLIVSTETNGCEFEPGVGCGGTFTVENPNLATANILNYSVISTPLDNCLDVTVRKWDRAYSEGRVPTLTGLSTEELNYYVFMPETAGEECAGLFFQHEIVVEAVLGTTESPPPPTATATPTPTVTITGDPLPLP